VTGDCHARIYGSRGVRLPPATRLPVRLRLRPPRPGTIVFGKQQRVIGRQGEFTQGPAVCQADRRRPLRQGPIGFRPAGHPESGWSDKVSADVERTPDSTSSSKNLTQTFRSQRPKDR
jgi:hypothetical protein